MSNCATLPTEIEEKIVDQLDNDFASLCNCALTCRAWVPRSRSLLLRAVRITTGSASDALLDYFRERKDMRPLAQSLATAPIPTERTRLLGTYPALLFGMLPNLRRWEIRAPVDGGTDPSPVSFHPMTLTQLRCSPITELHLSSIQFRSHADFIRLVSSVPRLRVLEFTDLQFSGGKAKSSTAAPPPSRRPLHLSTLQVCSGQGSDEDILPFLLELTQSSLQNLVLRSRKGFKWSAATPTMPQLRSLILHIDQEPGNSLFALFCRTFEETTNCMRALRSGSVLEQLEIHIHMSDSSNGPRDRVPCNDSVSLARLLLEGPILNRCEVLERDLLLEPADRSTRLAIMIYLPSLWTPREAVLRTVREDAFPGLYKKGLLDVGYRGERACQSYAPHNGPIFALVVSPDGRWIASASRDVGIICDAHTRRPMHEWIMPTAHVPSADSFAFSPDSNRLAYCPNVKGKRFVQIRDVEQGHKTTALQGHDFDDESAGSLSQLMCAWLPDRLLLASLARFTIVVQTWDAHTLSPQSTQEYATLFEHGSLLLSPDGRRLAGIAATTAARSPVASKQPVNHPRPRPIGRQRPRPASRHRPHAAGRARAALANHPLCMLWDLDAGDPDPGEVLLNGQHSEQVLAASFDRGSERLALSLADHTIRIWNTGTRQLLSMAEPAAREERGLLADRHARLWFLQTSSEVLAKAVAFTPDGGHLLSLRHMRSPEGRMETLLVAWDATSGVPLLRCGDALPSEVCRDLRLARFSPAGTHVALAAKGGRVHVIDLSSGWPLRARGFGRAEDISTRFGLQSDHYDATRLVFSLDGHTLCWGTQGGEVDIRSF